MALLVPSHEDGICNSAHVTLPRGIPEKAPSASWTVCHSFWIWAANLPCRESRMCVKNVCLVVIARTITERFSAVVAAAQSGKRSGFLWPKCQMSQRSLLTLFMPKMAITCQEKCLDITASLKLRSLWQEVMITIPFANMWHFIEKRLRPKARKAARHFCMQNHNSVLANHLQIVNFDVFLANYRKFQHTWCFSGFFMQQQNSTRKRGTDAESSLCYHGCVHLQATKERRKLSAFPWRPFFWLKWLSSRISQRTFENNLSNSSSQLLTYFQRYRSPGLELTCMVAIQKFNNSSGTGLFKTFSKKNENLEHHFLQKQKKRFFRRINRSDNLGASKRFKMSNMMSLL